MQLKQNIAFVKFPPPPPQLHLFHTALLLEKITISKGVNIIS